MNGRDDTTAFLPLDSEIGGPDRYNHPTVGQILTREQTRYIYKKVETGKIVKTNMMEQEIEQERQLDKMDDTSREINPCKELIVNNAEKIEPLMTQMEQWSILSNILNDIQHSRLNSMNHTLEIKAIDKNKYRPGKNSNEFKELDFAATPQKLQEEYMDVYEGIHSKVVSSHRFDKNFDICTTYLRRVNKEIQNKLKLRNHFLFQKHGYT